MHLNNPVLPNLSPCAYSLRSTMQSTVRRQSSVPEAPLHQTTPGFVLVKSMILHRFLCHLPIKLYTEKQFLFLEGLSYLASSAFCFALQICQRLVCKSHLPVFHFTIFKIITSALKKCTWLLQSFIKTLYRRWKINVTQLLPNFQILLRFGSVLSCHMV